MQNNNLFEISSIFKYCFSFIFVFILGFYLFQEIYAIETNISAENNINETKIIKMTNKEGEFSFSFPSDWNVTEKSNRFELEDVVLTKYSDTGKPISGIAMIFGTTNLVYDINGNIDDKSLREKILEIEIENHPQSYLMREIEPRKHGEYIVDGRESFSSTFLISKTYKTPELAGMVVLIIVDKNHFFSFAYGESPDTFDETLPEVEKILSSISFLNQTNTDNTITK